MLTRDDYLFDPTGGTPAGAGPWPRGLHPRPTLPVVFTETTSRAPAAPAIFDGHAWITWERWASRARAAAAALQSLGVRPGDVVALYLPNSWEFLVLHVAAASIGAVTFPLHTAYGDYEVGRLLAPVEPAVLVVPGGHRSAEPVAMGRRLVAGLAGPCVLVVADHPGSGSGAFRPVARAGPASPATRPEYPLQTLLSAHRGCGPVDVPVRPDDPLSLIVSSGSSSARPKLCIHTHGGQLENAAVTAAEGAAGPADTLLSASPFSHLFGLLSVHLAAVTGCRQALLDRWDPGRAARTAGSAGASVLLGTPTQLRDLIAHTRAEGSRPCLREVRVGGAPVSADLVRSARSALGASVVVQWGMSEVGAGTFTRATDPVGIVTSTIGRPAPGAQVTVVDQSGARVPNGVVGELWYRSPTMFRGYLGDPGHTADAVTPDGWLRTGDLASVDGDGLVTYQGRRTEFVNRGGFKFSVLEVEDLLSELPELAQFAVVSLPDERLGERTVLVATPRPGHAPTLGEITAHLAARGLARFKWPEQLLLVDEVPTTPTGKIARVLLRGLTEQWQPPAGAG